MSDPILVSTIARSAEALATAKKIRSKVQSDDAEGWFNPVKVDATVLEASPKYIQNGLKMLKKNLGLDISAYMVGANASTYGKWIRGTEVPNTFLSHRIRNVIEVVEILLAVRTPEDAKAWLVSPCEYLDPTLTTLPMEEIRTDPEAVRRAALFLFT